MSKFIYMHQACPHYTHTPLKMLDHLRDSHPELVAAILPTGGLVGLDALLTRSRLHTAPFPGVRVYPCRACSLLHYTCFEMQHHLQIVHADQVQRAETKSGEAGVSELVIESWLEVSCVQATTATKRSKVTYTNEVYINEKCQSLVSILLCFLLVQQLTG